MRSDHSTGSPELDRYLGGVLPGDSLLLFQASRSDAASILRPLLADARDRDAAVAYIRTSGSRDFLLDGLRVRTLSPGASAGRGGGRFWGWIRRQASAVRRGGILLLDDLADLAALRGGEPELLRFFPHAVRTVERRGGLLVATAVRGGLTPGALAQLKDAASIGLDLGAVAGDLLLIPVRLRGRFPAQPSAPFGFRIASGRGVRRKRLLPVHGFDTPHGAQIEAAASRQAAIAADLLEGPLGQGSLGIAVADLRGSFFALNDALRSIFGRMDAESGAAREERPDIDALVPPDRRRAALRFLARSRRGDPALVELPVLQPKGRRVNLRIRSLPAGEGLTLFLVERETAAATGASGGWDSAGLHDAPIPLFLADRRALLRMNRAFAALRGGAGTAARPLLLSDLFPPATLRAVRERMKGSAGAAGGSEPLEGELSRAAGPGLPVRISVAPSGSSGEERFLLCVEDISGLRSRIGALERAEARFRAVVEGMTQSAALLRGGAFAYANARCAALFGVPGPGDLAGRPLAGFLPEGERDAFTERLSKFAASRQPSAVLEAGIVRQEGAPLRARIVVTKTQGLPEADLLAEFEDVTARRLEAEHAEGLREGADRMRSILEAATGTSDLPKLIQTALDRSLEILGWSGGIVYLPEGDGGAFVAAASRRVPGRLLEAIGRLPASEGLGGYIAKTLESHIFSLDRYPSYLPHRTLFREHGVGRISLVPLVHADAPAGFILGVAMEKGGGGAGRGAKGAAPGRRGEAGPSAADLETLTSLGRHLGNAMANARRLEGVRESERRLQSVVHSLSGVVYTAAPDGTITSIDGAVTAALGYLPREFARNRALFLSLIHEEDKRIWLERVTGSEGLEETFTREYRMRPKAKAAFRWMRDSVTVVRGPDGGVAGFTGILEDVTAERERYREALEERSMLRAVRDAIPDGLAVFDEGGLCVDWNTTMEAITGIRREDAVGRAAVAIAPLPESAGAEELARAVALRRPARIGAVSPPAAGDGWYDVFLAPAADRSGAGQGFLLRYADVTARKAELDDLLRSEKVLLNVLNAMDDVMMITDLEGTIVEVNQAFLKVMRHPRSQVVGREFPYPWLVEEDMGRYLEWIGRIRERQWLHDFDVTWVPQGGAGIRMSLNTTLIRNSLGEPVAMLNVARDISDRVRLAEAVAERRNEAEMLHRIGAAALRAAEFPEIFRAVAAEVASAMPARAFFLLGPEGPGDPFSAALAFDGRSLTPGDLAPLADAGPETIITDLGADPRTAALGAFAGRFGSAAIVPVDADAGDGGRLGVFAAEPHALGEEDVALLRILARELSGIMTRLRLHHRVIADSATIRNLLDSIEEPVYTVDRTLALTRINRAGEEWLRAAADTPPGGFSGARLTEILPASPLREAILDAIREAAGGEGYQRAAKEVRLDGPGGTSVTRIGVTPLRDGTGGFVLSHADISALKATERELRERADQLIALHEISMIVSASFDIAEVLASALARLRSVLRARGILVYLDNRADGTLELARQEGFTAEGVAGVSLLRPDRSITGDVVRRRSSAYIPSGVADDGRIAPPNREFLLRHSLQAMAVVPIVAKEKIFGALDVFYDAPHEFSEQERRVLDLAGNQLGAAIESVHLYRELSAQVGRLTVLFELSRSLTALLDTAGICRAAFDHLRRVVDCGSCTISVPDRAADRLRVVLHAAREGGGYRTTWPGEGGAGDDGVPEPGEGAERALTARHAVRDDARNAVMVPMVSERAVAGVIEVVGAGPGPFDEVQVRLLESIANLAALALEKAGLHEETVRTSEQIARRNRELDDFTYVVSHDLKEPLISIEGFSRILQTDYEGVLQAEGREYLDAMAGAATRMKGLIDDLLMLSRVSRPPEAFGDVAVAAVLEEVRKDMEYVLRRRNVDLRIAPGLPVVRGNATQVAMIFRNLIGNAVKFNDKPRPVVEVEFQSQENNAYLFRVRDNGIGIEPEYFAKIFVIFQRLHRREEFEGSGAGLAIVKKIIEIHGGAIWVESVKGTGSSFCFTLPAGGSA